METNTNLITALIAFQGSVGKIQKSATGVHGAKYATLPAVMEKVIPELNKNDLAIIQLPTHIDGHPALRTRLVHKSGEFIEDTMPLIIPKQDPQGQGGSITYARRYALAAILGLVIDEDDDADKATNKVQSQGAYVAPKPVSKPDSTLATAPQVKLLLARSRDFSGLADRDEIITWFTEKTGVKPTEVKKSEVDEMLQLLESEKDV